MQKDLTINRFKGLQKRLQFWKAVVSDVYSMTLGIRICQLFQSVFTKQKLFI